MNRRPNSSRRITSGIVADARELGVCRQTLWKMLRGYPGFKNLKTLRARYDALQTAKRQSGAR